MKRLFSNNALTIVFAVLFLFSLAGQSLTGWKQYNQEREENHKPGLSMAAYLHTGHFIQATFENWESEFLQMGLFVILAVKLRQKGSSESKSFEEEEVDREPDPNRESAPWPVKKGGFILKLYKNSLSICFFTLFFLSFALHFYGSLKGYNEEQMDKNLPTEGALQYISNPNFWFESLQNWQSEFLSVFSLVVFSIFLRQQGSPQSKPVDAADSETGAG
ncbi:DUF6766 family protein [Filimonas effusa]|uniref:Transmembrane protein n=1 Tax=Filimonas effusa TaxID=2508721 RepID=A0A4Q1DB23_9BACT|nr:DUF6766 family protein [Filimonas effusa]RXK85763.1 hypothetical protein ESB13_02815 [Filimonas effusa]